MPGALQKNEAETDSINIENGIQLTMKEKKHVVLKSLRYQEAFQN